MQETLQVVPLQLTVPSHALRPEQRTVLPAAVVLIPPRQDRLPLQVMSHWFPAQLTSCAQLSPPPQVIWVLAATLVTMPWQPLVPPQVRVHSLPPHVTGPTQASVCPIPPQVMLHEVPCEQSTPPPHPLVPQLTSQGWLLGQVTT